jgi:hypothetical protein
MWFNSGKFRCPADGTCVDLCSTGVKGHGAGGGVKALTSLFRNSKYCEHGTSCYVGSKLEVPIVHSAGGVFGRLVDPLETHLEVEKAGTRDDEAWFQARLLWASGMDPS